MTSLLARTTWVGALCALIALAFASGLAARQAPPAAMRGYTLAGTSAQRDVETRFRALPSADAIRAWVALRSPCSTGKTFSRLTAPSRLPVSALP